MRPTGSLAMLTVIAVVSLSGGTNTVKAIQKSAYAIQIEATSDQRIAEQKVRQLREQGLEAYWIKSSVPGKGTYYRVRIGQFADKEAAMNFGASLKRQKITPDFLITTYQSPDPASETKPQPPVSPKADAKTNSQPDELSTKELPQNKPTSGKPQKEVLTNAIVIELVGLGLGESTIIEKIRQSECRFDTSLEGLRQLKAARVSDTVIREMMVPHSSTATAAPPAIPTASPAQAAVTNSSDPLAPHEPGIYLDEKGQLVEINPTTFSGTKANFLGTAFTYGIKKTKLRASARGSSANLVTANRRPVFYFYFDKSLANPGLAMSGFLSFGASSPGEFVLVKMERKGNTREAVLGEFNGYGSSTGAREKDVQEFSFEKVRPGVFKIVPRNNLEVGEYCFYYAGTPVGLAFAGGRIFDFSVNLPAM